MRNAMVVATLICCMAAAVAESVPVAKTNAALWIRHLVPLPKEITLERAVKLAPEDVVVIAAEGSGDVVAHAAELLAVAIVGEEGTPAETGSFEIRLVVAESTRLSSLRNSDQAYSIAPDGEASLVLTGLTERGVYYAALTLRDLIAAHARDDEVTIPLVTVTDWPDMAQRGLWGGNSTRDIEWMSAHKMNLVEAHVKLGVDDQGQGTAEISPEMLQLGRLNAFKVVPIITHLEQVQRTGIFDALPQTQGQGDPEKWAKVGHVRPACWSHPDTIRVLGDWMIALASQDGVTDICPWLAENAIKCECEKCAEQNQFALETAAILAGYERAKQVNPDLGLRILLTQGSYKSNEVVLSMLPSDVGVTYYDGGKTYDSSRDPMIYPLLEDWAAEGHWLGCYPQLTASWRIVCPWSGSQFIRYRMTEFVDKGLACLCGYATPNNRLYEFNVVASAEWTWNAHGRDEREFAAAYFTREGVADPDAAAEWAVTLGPVGWDVYGARVPYYWVHGKAASLIEARRAPKLGAHVFRYFETPERFDEDLAAVDRAMAIARELDEPVLIAETEVIGGYVTMLKMLHDIGLIVSNPDPPTEAQREQLNDQMHTMAQACADVVDGLNDWETTCGPGIGTGRFTDTIAATERAARDTGKALRPFGVQDPGAGYTRIVAGEWVSDDFEEALRITKTWEVTEAISGPDIYLATFNYRSGWHGLRSFRVALASAPADDAENLTELVVDEHPGTAAVRNTDNVYALVLDEHDPALRYFIVVDIRGTKSSDKPLNRRGCNGDVTFGRDRVPGLPLPKLPLLPVTADEAARYQGPSFAGEGVRVGVVAGGYGSEALLTHLRAAAGVQAQPLYHLIPDFIGRCQVVVLTQGRVAESFPAAAIAPLEEFVRGGGGLLTTHDAVGFRGLPVLCAEVCAGGVDKVRDKTWRVSAEHPVTAGLPRDTALEMGYYDFIGVSPGPSGVTVAVGDPSAAPAVVCGEFGNGRYVACGIGVGIGGSGAEETPPTAPESTLLLNAIRWLARA